MTATLTIRDESSSGQTLHEFALEVPERITVRELIRSRVYQEVKDFNVRQPERFQGLVQPSDAERAVNGCGLRKRRQINWKAQYERALTAFRSGQILVLLDDRQLESLDEQIVVTPTSRISFLRLTLLVGG